MNKDIKSFYRVYRPKQFDEVIGQEHITKTLVNQIRNGNIGHAYLFCGTRGTGKTSVAKIFANAVNCLNFKEGKTCGVCEYCKRAAKDNLDVLELDAASNNRVEDVRELIEKVKYPPLFAKYKVYIVDEVHMFSGSAFNAFLKTLEEPPAHLIFILATTEPHKLIPTVLSRCLRFDFRSISTAEIKKMVEKIFKKEKIIVEPEALQLIAEAGCGSARDALSFADMCNSYCDGNITARAVFDILGAVDKKILNGLFESILANNIDDIIKTTDEIFLTGRNTSALVKDFLSIIKSRFIKEKDETIGEIFRLFAELEQNIKNATDAANMFQSACLIASEVIKKKMIK